MTPYGVTECLTSGPGLTCLHDITCVPLFTQYVRRMDLQMFAYHCTSFCTRYWLWWWWWILFNNCHYDKQRELSLHSFSIEWHSPCLHNITPTMIHLALPAYESFTIMTTSSHQCIVSLYALPTSLFAQFKCGSKAFYFWLKNITMCLLDLFSILLRITFIFLCVS